MNFKLKGNGEIQVISVFKDTINIEKSNKLYQHLKSKEIFKANVGEVYTDVSCSSDKILFLGLGDKAKVNLETLRKSFFNAGRELMKLKIESLEIQVPEFVNLCYIECVQAIVEGLLQSEYNFDKYLNNKKFIPTIKDVFLSIVPGKEASVLDAIDEVKDIMAGVNLTRNLNNEPPIVMTPKFLADSAKYELEPLGVKVKIYGEKQIEELGMKAFLAVSKGSSQEPQLIVMEYEGEPESDKKLALVGKGITYDSGGYSIKPTESMATMYTDMGGAASVIGAMTIIAKSNIKKNIVGVIAACENLISGDAYKPGDIIKSMSGKTIEILNTDAEGRLTLADALWFTVRTLGANKVVDVATLTGACVIALGHVNSGAITNNMELMADVKAASERAGESIWQLPTNDEYRELIKGDFADLKNSGDRAAGPISASLFLEEFVDNIPWVHLDISGPAYLPNSLGYLPKRASGVPVKTLYYLAKQ